MNQPWIYMCSPSWTPLPSHSPSYPSGSSQCTSPEHLPHASNLDWWSVYHLFSDLSVNSLFLTFSFLDKEVRVVFEWVSMSRNWQGLSGGSVIKYPPANSGDTGLIPGSGRLHGEGNGNMLQYSCLENPMDRGAWWATVHGVAKSQTQLRLNNNIKKLKIKRRKMLIFKFTRETWRSKQHSCIFPNLCNPMDCSLPGSSIMGFSRQEY